MENYLNDLNESQRAAVLYNDGPAMIIAGAGSGKTRVLTYKIAYLISQGLPPYAILALTFTNKAANEMKERIARVVGPSVARQLWMGTFHSIFARILRREAEHIGYKSDFTIYDSADTKNLLKSIVREMDLDEKVYKPASLYAQISNAKNNLVTPHMYANNAEIQRLDRQANRPRLGEIYMRYWHRCRNAGAMDFDDLLLNTNILFRDHKEVLAKYQELFRYILVDEYQDTNRSQHLIIELLAKANNRVCVVGDDAQSIYAFRGANIANILNFRNSIPGTKLFKLEQNYRSTQTIVKAANSLIKKNTEQIDKTIFSENSVGDLIPLRNFMTDFEEAYWVSRQIAHVRDDQRSHYQDFVVLYRTNAQSRVLEEAMRKNGIPYRIYGGLSFYQRKEVKDVVAYLRLIVNGDDEEAFKRVINFPKRGIGDTTVEHIAQAALRADISFMQVLADPLGYALDVRPAAAGKLRAFRELIETFRVKVGEMNAYELVQYVIRESGIAAELAADKSPEGMSRQENVDSLLAGVYDFVKQQEEAEEGGDTSLATFLTEVSLATDQDTDSEADTDKVTLMTIHASKGLEFRNVFIVGLEEDLFPSAMAKETPGGLEEERRLFYVAITRAEERCWLTYAGQRFRNGQMQPAIASRFLRDIDPAYLDKVANLRVGEEAARRGADWAATTSWGSSHGTSSRSTDYGPSSRRDADYGASSRRNADASPSPRREADYGSSPRRDASMRSGGSSYGTSPRNLRPLTASTSAKGGGNAAGIPAGLKPGVTVRHKTFGEGIVLLVEGSGNDASATVDFGGKTRKLLLKFAKFDAIG